MRLSLQLMNVRQMKVTKSQNFIWKNSSLQTREYKIEALPAD
jgi:hypothetical protein